MNWSEPENMISNQKTKRVARGVRGFRMNPTLQKRSAKFAYYICIVHVGNDDLARSGVYVRTCR